MTRDAPLRFTWSGRILEAREGDSIAASLAAHGIVHLGASRTGRPRGVFCGMGACHECLVVVDGRRSERACMVEVRDGMDVVPHRDEEPVSGYDEAPLGRDESEHTCDAVIVGAGPAGLNAGIALREHGHSVQVLDERPDPGGQYYKSRTPGYRGDDPPDRQHRDGSTLRNQAAAAGLGLISDAAVWYARRDPDETEHPFVLKAVQGSRALTLRARAVILATGALEAPPIIPGWTLPGAMTIGAAQTLARRYGTVPGERILVASNGPLGMQLTCELSRLGGKVVACAERASLGNALAMTQAFRANPRLALDGLAYRLRLLFAGIGLWRGWEVIRIHGETAAEGATLRRLADGRERRVSADTVCIGDAFSGQIELARLLGVPVSIPPATFRPEVVRERNGRTVIPGVWIAGDAGGLRGAQWANAQGRLAGEDAARFLGSEIPSPAGGGGLARAERFQKALWTLYRAPPRPLGEAGLTLCRCEEVTLGKVSAAIERGAADLGAIKRATRLGMGRCQGRYCTAPALRLLAEHGIEIGSERLMAPQLPAKPVRVSSVASEKPEWKGYARMPLTRRPMPADSRPLRRSSADLAVIGGGITGIVASLSAAQDSAEVVCLERGTVNCEASGGNAGSLHLQLLSWDYGARNVFADVPLRTLPLQKEGIETWIALERELGKDFEISLTGGMMVAEDRAQLDQLVAKSEAEHKVGIETTILDGDEVRRLVPLISERIVGAALCKGEGRINPLLASGALLDRARQLGATFEEFAGVEGVDRTDGGYRIRTRRGELVARRILIAAGGWSTRIGRMFRADLPVRGSLIQIVATEPVPAMAPCLIAHAGRHITMKQTRSGNILIGGAWSGEVDRDGHPRVKLASLEGNLWVAERIMPALGPIAFIRSWSGMNIGIDGAPLLSTLPGHPEVTVAASGNGYTLAPVIGREAARLALTGQVRPDLERFGLERFRHADP